MPFFLIVTSHEMPCFSHTINVRNRWVAISDSRLVSVDFILSASDSSRLLLMEAALHKIMIKVIPYNILDVQISGRCERIKWISKVKGCKLTADE